MSDRVVRIEYDRLCPVLNRLIGDLKAELALHEPNWKCVQLTFWPHDLDKDPIIDVITQPADHTATLRQVALPPTILDSMLKKIQELQDLQELQEDEG